MAEGGLSDEELLQRLRALYDEDFVAGVAAKLAEARKHAAVGTTGTTGDPEARLAEIHARYTYRMHDLSQFMKGLLIRFTHWFNRTHMRTGGLWEARFKSVIVEGGVAARTVAAYIDLNPVRAGMVVDPKDYRWCSYGEAIGDWTGGNGNKAREGLTRTYLSDQGVLGDQAGQGVGLEGEKWQEVSRLYRLMMGLALDRRPGYAQVPTPAAKGLSQSTMNMAEALESDDNGTVLKDLGMAKLLLCRVRYFTDGAVIGSKEFVNEAFTQARERFGAKRQDGARKFKGDAATAASGVLWSLRDLRKGIA